MSEICKECGEHKGDWLANKLQAELAEERARSKRLAEALKKIADGEYHMTGCAYDSGRDPCKCADDFAEEALREYGQ